MIKKKKIIYFNLYIGEFHIRFNWLWIRLSCAYSSENTSKKMQIDLVGTEMNVNVLWNVFTTKQNMINDVWTQDLGFNKQFSIVFVLFWHDATMQKIVNIARIEIWITIIRTSCKIKIWSNFRAYDDLRDHELSLIDVVMWGSMDIFRSRNYYQVDDSWFFCRYEIWCFEKTFNWSHKFGPSNNSI